VRRALAAAVVALLGTLAFAASALGSLGATLALLPADQNGSWITMRVDPGEVVAGRAVLRNLTDRAQTAVLTAVDATTTGDGAFTLAGDDEPRAGVGRWASVDRARVALAPGEQRVVRYRVRVPADAEPGDYAGGLVARAEGAASREGAGGVTVTVVERVGLRVYVDVAGVRDGTLHVEDVAADTAGGSPVKDALGLPSALEARFTVRHDGNVRYDDLRGRIELRRGDSVVETRELALGTLLPGAERPVTARLPLPGFSAGDWTLRVTLDGEPPVTVEARVGVSAWRVWAAGGIVGLGMIGATGAGMRRRRNAFLPGRR
jgi:hypothetical protein